MAVYCVTYGIDQGVSSWDCESLNEKVKRFPNYCRAQESVWLISTHWNAGQITAYLKSALDSQDKLTVILVRGWSAMQESTLPCSVASWLKKHLESASG